MALSSTAGRRHSSRRHTAQSFALAPESAGDVDACGVGALAGSVKSPDQPVGVGALYVVHRNPQLSVGLATVVHPHDVGVEQGGGEVSLPLEACAVVGVGGYVGAEDFQCLPAWQPGMLGQIHISRQGNSVFKTFSTDLL